MSKDINNLNKGNKGVEKQSPNRGNLDKQQAKQKDLGKTGYGQDKQQGGIGSTEKGKW